MLKLRILQVATWGLLGAPLATAQAAQGVDTAQTSAADAETAVAPDSPRASLTDYLDQCRAGRFAQAARYLSLSGAYTERGPELARRLKAVLDRHVWVDLDTVSPLPQGRQDDGLPEGTDQLGSVPRPRDHSQPVRMRHLEDAKGARWVFTSGTVTRIDAWYEALDDHWIRERLPEPLLRPGPRELLYWQWLALPVLLAVAWLAGRLLTWITLGLLGRLQARTHTVWDDVLLARLAAPLILAWGLAIVYLALPWLALAPPALAFIRATLHTGGLLAVFWMLWRAVDCVGSALVESAWVHANPSARSALSIGTRIGKAAVLALALIAALTQVGYPVVSLLAGVGLGGLALALAAQKTVENLFGSIALAVDQPFHVGDLVKIEDFTGTVEAIGLRSTRVRTLDRTLITLPNGRLADMRLESLSARDRLRLACTLNLVYGTSAAQMKTVLAGLERVLRAHPKIWPDAVVVRFKELAASSLDIEVMAWFQTSEWPEFQLIRQEVLLQFLDVVEQAGTSFAFPTRTVHVVAESVPA